MQTSIAHSIRISSIANVSYMHGGTIILILFLHENSRARYGMTDRGKNRAKICAVRIRNRAAQNPEFLTLQLPSKHFSANTTYRYR
jgi:hypothetical protein